MAEFGPVVMGTDEGDWQTAMRWAAAFLAGFQSAQTRKSYPPPAAGTRYRRIATLSSWFRWLEDEDVAVGNPAARIRRPQRACVRRGIWRTGRRRRR